MYKTTIEVRGMMCGMCESHVNDAVRGAFDASGAKPPRRVASSRSRNETVIVTESAPDEALIAKLRDAIAATGYEVGAIATTDDAAAKKRGFFGIFGK